jgi:hypothetical protein
MSLAEASELFHYPARPAEWQVLDPVLRTSVP